MITMPDLQTALLDLLYEVQGTELKLIIGGGYGIYLKNDHVRRMGMRTLLREWPEPRSTNDLDLFLRPELLINPVKLKPLANAIDRLGYQAVQGAEKYQFAKSGPGGIEAGSIKIDILTGPRKFFKGTKVKADARRARPKPCQQHNLKWLSWYCPMASMDPTFFHISSDNRFNEYIPSKPLIGLGFFSCFE
jgi:hypothetical protein